MSERLKKREKKSSKKEDRLKGKTAKEVSVDTVGGKDSSRKKTSQKNTSQKEQPRMENHKNVTSITRQLHFHQIWKNLGIYFRLDLLLFLLSTVVYLIGQEMAMIGTLSFRLARTLTTSHETGQLVYRVMEENGKILVETPLNDFLRAAGIVVGGLFALQFLGMWICYFFEDRNIRRILSPLDKLALRADELSRISFSEDKYQELEDATTMIEPGDTSPLSLGDKDLAGVETAMNNLLLRMRDTYRQQARFVNDASHELRTPIAVIQGYVNMLDRWGKEDPKILEESINAIRHESDHMKNLVEQLLFLARGDSGKTELHLEEIDLNDMMREVYEESFMIDENHPYRFSREDTPLKFQADPGLLKQAVRILVDNAAKYTQEGNEIYLSTGITQDGEYYLQVQDTGIGMAEADVQHMFDRFYRSDDVRSYDGTGLGLSIAKWIVDKHKGHFEILSRPGLGTRIRILLDPARAQGNENQSEEDALQSRQGA